MSEVWFMHSALGEAAEVSVAAPAIEVEEGASVVQGGASVIAVEEEALATVDVVALEEEEVEVQTEVDSEGGVVAEVHQEAEVVQEEDLEQEGRLLWNPTGMKVNDDILARAFSRYPSFLKAKVVRDKRTGKTKGYGFVSFKDPNDYVRAMREMNGKYVGSRPIKLRKSMWKDRNMDVVRKKQREKKKLGIR
ncbi:unnamed protein product [Boreogadus saida]